MGVFDGKTLSLPSFHLRPTVTTITHVKKNTHLSWLHDFTLAYVKH